MGGWFEGDLCAMLHVTVDRKRKTVMDGVHVIVTIDAK